jgi:carbamoylphosphate synthase large subunit
MSLAEVAEKLGGLPGFDSFETASIIHHKDKFRKYAEEHAYPIPKAILRCEDSHHISFPVMVKPVDSFSGKGINKAYNEEELKAYWIEAEKFSINGQVVAEEFVEGKLYSHSAFIKNGKILVDFFVNEYCTIYPYQVNSSNLATKLQKKIIQELRDWTEQFAEDLKLCDGLIHTQFISNNETFSLIEIARRCPGDLYSQLIQKSTGINYAALYAMPFCGLTFPDTIQYKEQRAFSRHTVSVKEPCIFISSEIDINALSIQNIQLKYSGETMKAAPYDKSGIYFIEYNQVEEMEALTEKLKDHVLIETLDVQINS